MRLQVLSLVALLASAPLSLSQTTNVSGPWTYVVRDNEATVIRYSGAGGEVRIPSSLGGYTVWDVYGRVFGITNDIVTSLIIPNGVRSIGDSAFRGSYALTNVIIPSTVTKIDGSAFTFCRSLKSVVIPDSVKTIGDRAFQGCTSLEGVTVGRGVTFIGFFAFQSSSGALKSFVFLGDAPAAGIGGVFDSLYPPASVLRVAGTAGWGSEWAFNPVSVLPWSYSVNFDQEATISGYAGSGGAVTLPTRIGAYEVKGISTGSDAGNDSVTSVTIPSAITSIGFKAFYRWRGLTNVTIPTTVTNIEDYAFDSCTSLTSISIPNSVKQLGVGAFQGCSSLATILFRGNAPAASGNVFGTTQAKIHYLKGTTGWGATLAGVPVTPFAPVVVSQSIPAERRFQFSWTGTGTIPMRIQRSTAAGGPWANIATNNTSRTFTDTNRPSAQAFYRAVLQ
jgi:hypothetical protein